MQHLFAGSLFISLLVSVTALADAQHGHAMNHDAIKVAQYGDGQPKLTDGVVKEVDLKNGKATLQHGEIANVKMPAMTMDYRVKQTKQLESIHSGDKVRFAVEKLNDDYVVTHIEPAR